MGINNVKTSAEKAWDLSTLFENIKEDGLLVRDIEIEYRSKSSSTLIRPRGIPKMSLSSNFMDEIKNQFNKLSTEVIAPLIRFSRSDFTLTLQVNTNGEFSFNELNICLKPEVLREKSIYRRYNKVVYVFSYFAEHLEYFEIQGRQYSVQNIFGNLTLSIEDLREIIEHPIPSPKAKEQWYNFLIEAEEEAEKRFSLDVKIPCFEGEVVWEMENKYVRLHHLEVMSDKKVVSDKKVTV